jgi:PTH1 family peptidyl-tRNA hydrolase
MKVEHGGEKILLAMPQTYMNQSGEAIKQIVQNCEIMLEKLLIIYDDFDIPLGEIRIRKEGGAGTHKGMTSIIQELGSSAFPRIRIGIGPLPEGADAVEYVLSPFSKEEKPRLEASLAKASDALALILAGEIDKAMNQFN